MKYTFAFLAAMLSTAALAQNNERITQIRSLYAQAQETLKSMNEDAQINWSVKTTMLRNEAAVGVVRYETEYYPLHRLNASDFVRQKRYVSVFPPTTYEILYDQGKPAFYYQREDLGEGIYEYRIYWDENGEVCQYLPQHIVDGKKERLDSDGIETWYRAKAAYQQAMQLLKVGLDNYEGVSLPKEYPAHSKAELFDCVSRIYATYYQPALEGDEEGDSPEMDGLGKMYRFVTEKFNETYCMCVSKSISTNEIFLEYDFWTNSQEDTSGVTGITIKDFTPDAARVVVQIDGADGQRDVILQMNYDAEQQTWLVSDLIYPNNGKSFLQQMESYLAN